MDVKSVMRVIFARSWAASLLCATFVSTFAATTTAYAQYLLPGSVELDVTATFVYPTNIQPGDTFPVYAWINNQSQQAILAPYQQSVIVRSHLGTYYMSDACRLHCVFARSRVIPPGGKVLIHMGDVYTNTRALNPGEFVWNNQFMLGFTLDNKLYFIDIEDTIPATIDPFPMTIEQAPLMRQALVLTDDGNRVRDPNTGYEWLRFSHSVGITEEELERRLQADGDLNAFSIATRYQVQELLINHMNAEGIALTPATFLSHVQTIAGHAALKQFVELIEETSENTKNLFYISGVLNDRVPLMDGARQFARMTITFERESVSDYNSGPMGFLMTAVLDENSLINDAANTGVWLVRGAEVNRHQSTGAAAYADDYLFLPNVVIDGVNYRLEMFRKEGTAPSFVVTDIRAASELDLAQPVAVFNIETGQLSVKNVEVMSDLPAGKYDLTLEWIPGTELPLVKLTHVSLSADPH